MGLLPAHSVAALPPDDYRGYVEKLSDAAGIAPPAPYPSERLSPARWDTSPTNDLRRLHHDAATAATALLATLPAAIVAPAEANVYRGDDLLTPELDAHRLAREAPLLILGGVASSTGIDDERFWRCAIGGAYQRLLLQLIGDTRPLRRSGLPGCDRGADIVRKVLEVAEIMLGAPIPFVR